MRGPAPIVDGVSTAPEVPPVPSRKRSHSQIASSNTAGGENHSGDDEEGGGDGRRKVSKGGQQMAEEIINILKQRGTSTNTSTSTFLLKET